MFVMGKNTSKLGISEAQFLRRVELLDALRDLGGVVVAIEVLDILKTKGNKKGRFKW